MKTVRPSLLLKIALRADALVSGACGMLQLAAADRLAMLLELPRSLLLGSGECMLVYALALLLLAGRQRLASALVLFIVVGNLLWAVASVALPLEGRLAPNALGWAFLLVQAAAVAALAAFQWLGLRRSTDTTAEPGPPRRARWWPGGMSGNAPASPAWPWSTCSTKPPQCNRWPASACTTP